MMEDVLSLYPVEVENQMSYWRDVDVTHAADAA
jgi:hypothetical protein